MNTVETATPEVVAPKQNSITEARKRLSEANALNGKVIKYFKSHGGKKEMFVPNEPVSVLEATEEENLGKFQVQGLSYNHKNGKLSHKTALFDGDTLIKYVTYSPIGK